MKKQTKIGLALVFSPFILSPILLILLALLDPKEGSFFRSNIFNTILPVLFLIMVVSGIWILIKNIDKKNNVSKKRKIIGEVILFGILTPTILFLILSSAYNNLVKRIERDVRKEYINNNKSKDEDYELEPVLIGNYEFEPDEYIWSWNKEDYGYYELTQRISTPRLYIPREIYTVKKSWILKNNYKLDLECNPVDAREVETENSYKCKISYNGKVIDTNIRHDIFCFWENKKTCTDNIGIVLFSNSYSQGDVEHLFIFAKENQDHNNLSVYKLENGEVLLLPFKYEHKGQSFSDPSYTISGTMADLYGIKKYGIFDLLSDGEIELVTSFGEPTMGIYNNVQGIHSIWSVENDGLYLRRTLMELIKDWKSEGTKEGV